MPPKGWRRGIPSAKAVEVEVTKVQETVQGEALAVVPEPVAPLTPIAESRKSLNEPLQHGQAFFEAPDGFIMIGDATADRMYYRAGNDGKGMWINKRRA